MRTVKEKNPKILVVYDGKASDLAEAAQNMFHTAQDAGQAVRIASAADVKLAEVLAADLLVFGAQDSDSDAYSELKRVFKGVNLAGRKAAFFFARGSHGVKALKASLQDTEIAVFPKDLDIGSKSADVAAWIKKTFKS